MGDAGFSIGNEFSNASIHVFLGTPYVTYCYQGYDSESDLYLTKNIVTMEYFPRTIPITANAANNGFSASSYSVKTGDSVNLTAYGDRQTIPGIVAGDERYIPTTWVSTETGKSGTFTLNTGSYTSVYTPQTAGDYTVTATIIKQAWDGTAWNDTGTSDSKTFDITVLPEFAGGSGTAEDPYLISTADQLNNVRNHLDKHFLQTADLDLSGYSTGEGWVPIGDDDTPFAGTYDGNEFSINNLYIERDEYYSGLFGYIGGTGMVTDLELKSVNVIGNSYYVGSLAGTNEGLISYCSAAGTVAINGRYYPLGGLVGENLGTITHSSFNGTVESDDDYVGGLVGRDEGTIISCHTTGSVKGDDEVGGLVGYKVRYGGDIKDSYSECNVEIVNSDSTQTGGLVGNNDGTLDGCYATGTVAGYLYVGGLVGYNYKPGGVIVNCYALGPVEGYNYVGGLVGGNSYSVSNSYSAGTVTSTAAEAQVGGLVGYGTINGTVTNSYWDSAAALQSSSAGGEGKTTAEMNQRTTFTDWDFDTIWGINDSDNNCYPFLRWQGFDAGEPATAPAEPQNLAATPGEEQVELSWTAPASDGGSTIIKYQVSNDNGTSWTDVGLNTTHTFTGLTNGTEYTFKVRAVNSIGNGAEASASATPIAPVIPDTEPAAPQNFTAVPGDKQVELNWTAPASDGGSAIIKYQVSKDNGTSWTDAGLNTTYTFTGLTSGTEYTFRVRAVNSIGNGAEESIIVATTTPPYNANVKEENGNESTLPITVDSDAGSASVDTDSQRFGQGATVITIPSIPDVNAYSVGIPVPDLSTTGVQGTLTLNTDEGSITIPSNMLTGVENINGSRAQISINEGDKSNLPEDVRDIIGDRPLIQLSLSIDGRQTEWSNQAAPVVVTIPYIPTTDELANPESIVVWYIDGSGNAVSVPNGRYDPETGTVTFATTHFSYYAVGYNDISFKDVANDAWYAKAVSFIAAREIMPGTGDGNFSPESKLTRAQFVVMLMNAYGIAPDLNPKDNFADAGNEYYTGYLAEAKRMGISAGIGNNIFAPDREITRQEMFTMLYRALKAIGRLRPADSGKTLAYFSDAEQIDAWAKDAITQLVSSGVVSGSSAKLSPRRIATRAEMAQLLYNLLGK